MARCLTKTHMTTSANSSHRNATYATCTEPAYVQGLGNSIGIPNCFIPFSSCADPGRSGVAADQITELQVAVSQFPPKVTDGPVFTSKQSQLTRVGSLGST